MLKRTILLLVLIALCISPTTLAAKRKRNETQTVVIPVYDTIRVVITDTIKVKPTPAPRIDTLHLAHSPAEIDSLVEAWTVLHQAQSEKSFFDTYAGDDDTTENTPVDSLYKQRLLDMVSPVHLPYNYIVRNFINQYLNGRWSSLSSVLALSKYYFPIIEEELHAAGLPLELRYLPIIESNLSIRATSRMGAVGLWQFMPATGKNLGLEINSLVDERCDVLKSTRAACKFLAHLYKTYGDWTLAIAAYNCGPGNVNRALARAGENCKTFWDIYDFLPRETRGYVPKYIAAAYAYTYHKAHNIEPKATPDCIATDTVMVHRVMHLGQVASTLNIPIETLRDLNPQYKLDIVPATKKAYSLRLPTRYTSEFISNEKAIHEKDSLYLKEYLNPANLEKKRAEGVGYIYTVRKGDNLGLIAKRNRCTVKELMKWNRLKSTVIRPGQKLRIEKPKPRG
ncbi:MAG: LysM peptidoglycan-binding domain-containing protein [Rikenellaceae bacterium]|nr:LysM peptidoglycan-binding domain-containing protein [Rikenellaceae bacterium]